MPSETMAVTTGYKNSPALLKYRFNGAKKPIVSATTNVEKRKRRY
jgi:hypothetical protein